MAPSDKPKKVVILGGGMGGLTTAFELSSDRNWQQKYDITIYQIGWRLGGKCATGRNPDAHDRLEEHGIHGFLGCYYNALSMMHKCYAELDRPPEAPLATFSEAFVRRDSVLRWEYHDETLKRWPIFLKPNALNYDEISHEELLSLSNLGSWLQAAQSQQAFLADRFARIALLRSSDVVRRLRLFIDFFGTIVRGVLADNLMVRGFDAVDDEDFADWLRRHGAQETTISSPPSLSTPNITYQYPDGDTSLPPKMSAASYLQWTLRTIGFVGNFIYLFAAGTGETLIAPLYLALKHRGVKFRFFHKVEALRLAPDGGSIGCVEMLRQATPKAGPDGYNPLYDVKGLPSWPNRPFYDQLQEGEVLADYNLESYWSDWTGGEQVTLNAGEDFDELVLAISIGALPYLCSDLATANAGWRDMLTHMKTVQTQAMQLWFDKSATELGWLPYLPGGEPLLSANYLTPPNGQADFTKYVQYENWPPDHTPGTCLYICGTMPDLEELPPFDDHDFPRRQFERVRYQSIQYLQSGSAPMLPLASVAVSNPPGDSMSLDFNLLTTIDKQNSATGAARFADQFWIANINPSDRYVSSVPGSGKYRLKAWDRSFSNLVIAGDWIYTGLNVGSVEGAVTGGRLAAHAIDGSPALDQIYGYKATAAPPVT